MDTALQTLRCALRRLGRSPGFVAVAILTLALGIGLATAVFTVAETLLLRPLPVREPARLVSFRSPGPLQGHVVDFLSVGWWPVFNVADICINVAAGLIILQTFRGIALDGTRDSEREREST